MPVFNEVGKLTDQWQASRNRNLLTISAGHLNQFSGGSILAVYSQATDKKVAALATVVKSSAMQSKARINNDFDANQFTENVYVRLLTPKVDFQLAIHAMRVKGQSAESYKALSNAISKVASKNEILLRYEGISSKANMFVSYFENKLWFISPEQHLPCNVQYGLTEKERVFCSEVRKLERLSFLNVGTASSLESIAQQGLLKIAKVRNLLTAQSILSKKDKAIKIDFLIERGETNKEEFDLSPKLKTGDWVNLNIKNTSNNTQDITVLFIDSQYGIQQAYPRSGEASAIKPNGSIVNRFQINVDTVGYEYLIVLHAESTGITQSFSFLEQEPISVMNRGIKNNDVGQLSPFQKIMRAVKSGQSVSRGIVIDGEATSPANGMSIFSWETMH